MRKRSRLKIHLNILKENFQKVKKLSEGKKTIFMVKANAYGHGLVPIVDYAFQTLKIDTFGCASMGEAMCLRNELVDLNFNLIVFSDFNLEEDAEAFLNRRIVPVISNIRDLKYFLSQDQFRFLPLYLKFNTGMYRLGLPMSALDETINLLKSKNRHVDHLMTHFANATLDIKLNSQNKRQIKNYQQIRDSFKQAGLKVNEASLCNSGGLIQKLSIDETHVRPGLMMYGPSGMAIIDGKEIGEWDGRPVSELETCVVDTFYAEKGTPIGYGGSPCPYAGQIAILGIGYGDGIGTNYSGVELKIKGGLWKIVGRVSMDMTAIQRVDESGEELKINDRISLWGPEASDNFARICRKTKMIPYEVFCNISNRIPRIYAG